VLSPVRCLSNSPDQGPVEGSGIVGLVTPADVSTALSAQGYLPDEGIATSVFLAMTLHRPLLLEGEAGVGKTELAKSLAKATGGELIRLQCYEGIDASQAVYDWDYAKQLLHLRATEATRG
jgi:MoxR-like ATPase